MSNVPKMSENFIVFLLDNQSYALPLNIVERIVRAVEITPLPKAPNIVFGIINVQGQVVPVVNVRRRFGLQEREIDIDDRLIVVRTSKRVVVFPVDEVDDVRETSKHKMIPAERITPGMEHIAGVIKLNGDMILIHDIDRFLSLDEETLLQNAIDRLEHETNT